MGRQLKKLAKNVQNQQMLNPVAQPSKDVLTRAVEQAKQEGLKEGTRKGLESGFIYGIDSFERAISNTKGVGEKKSKSLRDNYVTELHKEEAFRSFVDGNNDSVVMYAVPTKMVKLKVLIDEIMSLPEKETNLTLDKLLSILSSSDKEREDGNEIESGVN